MHSLSNHHETWKGIQVCYLLATYCTVDVNSPEIVSYGLLQTSILLYYTSALRRNGTEGNWWQIGFQMKYHLHQHHHHHDVTTSSWCHNINIIMMSQLHHSITSILQPKISLRTQVWTVTYGIILLHENALRKTLWLA